VCHSPPSACQCLLNFLYSRLTPVLRRCCGVRLLLRGGTRHIYAVDTEQGGLVTSNRIESRAREDATRAKDQDNVCAIVGEGRFGSDADIAAIFCDDPVIMFRMGIRPAISWAMREASSARAPSVWCSLRIVPAMLPRPPVPPNHSPARPFRAAMVVPSASRRSDVSSIAMPATP
jgi:hypothetical protein